MAKSPFDLRLKADDQQPGGLDRECHDLEFRFVDLNSLSQGLKGWYALLDDLSVLARKHGQDKFARMFQEVDVLGLWP